MKAVSSGTVVLILLGLFSNLLQTRQDSTMPLSISIPSVVGDALGFPVPIDELRYAHSHALSWHKWHVAHQKNRIPVPGWNGPRRTCAKKELLLLCRDEASNPKVTGCRCDLSGPSMARRQAATQHVDSQNRCERCRQAKQRRDVVCVDDVARKNNGASIKGA